MSEKIISTTPEERIRTLEKALQQKESIIAGFQEITGDTIQLPIYAGLPVFWRMHKDKVRFLPDTMRKWSEKKGFFKSLKDDRQYHYLSETSNIIDSTSPAVIAEEMRDFIELYYSDLQDSPERSAVINAFAGRRRNIENNMTSHISVYRHDVFSRNFSPLWDTKDSVHFFFANSIVTVLKDRIEHKPYEKAERPIWKDNVLPYEYEESNGKNESIVKTFFLRCAGNDETRLHDLERIAGYSLSRYKPASEAKAVNLYGTGGSGKSLFVEILGKLRNTAVLKAEAFRASDKFKYQSIGQETNILNISELDRKFDLTGVFNDITNDLVIEKKNKPATTIKYEISPKWIFTRNYPFSGLDSQYTRRLVEFKFSNIYNEDNRPIDEFGKEFFRPESGWTDEDTSQALNYLFHCVQQYLIHGLPRTSTEDILLEKVISAFGDETVSFFEEQIKPGEQYSKRDLHIAFADLTGISEMKQTSFTKALESYLKAKGFRFEFCGHGRQEIRIIPKNEPEKKSADIIDFPELSSNDELLKQIESEFAEAKETNGTPKSKAVIEKILVKENYCKNDIERAKRIYLDLHRPEHGIHEDKKIIYGIIEGIRRT